MNEHNHTPGPWRVSYERGTTEILTSDNESIMCDETYYPWVPDNPADWDLIAAAPDMLEALEELADLLDATVSGEYTPDSFTTQYARRVITKAKGQETK